ncbi:MAG TPA: hypothetical protein VK927_11485, partial [Adhaeribacter sp.]|nr:hypothetical protein [Adhaeribacter sp.]
KLRTRSLNLALNVYITETLALQPGDELEYWQTPLFGQRLLIAANGIAFTYQTFAERFFYFLLANALLALIGLLPFIPGQIRVTTITISGLFSFFFIMLLL